MRKLLFKTFLLLMASAILLSCEKEDNKITPDKPKEENISLVSQFVYDGLSAYYLWSNEMINKKPTPKDNDPEVYFESVLSSIDKQKGWSWITDDVKALMSQFEGKPKSFGMSLTYVSVSGDVFALVRYVYPNSPAANAGIKRLDYIGKINGKSIGTEKGDDGNTYINRKDVEILNGGASATFSIYNLENKTFKLKNDVALSPAEISADPVVYDEVIKIGDKKIGYLFYTGFTPNYNNRLYEVFSKFKQENITDLVLDLRYNPGGNVTAATYLASLFAPQDKVKSKEILTKLSYNNFLNDLFDKENMSRSSKLGVYNDKNEQNPLTANVDMKKIYVIATASSASASELVTFCSRAFMGQANVVHIGGKTSGKYTASWTIHPYDDDYGVPIYDAEKLNTKQKEAFGNWAMQPIVAIYTDKNGNSFATPGYLQPDYELKEGFGYVDYWKPLGDPADVFLGQALYLITGDAKYQPVQPAATKSSNIRSTDLPADQDEIQPLVIDNVKLSKEMLKTIREHVRPVTR